MLVRISFSDFGYDKLECVFDIKLTLYVAHEN